MPYRIAGEVIHDGQARVVLMKGDRLFTAQAGEALDDGYRVHSVGAHGVTLVYEALGAAQQLPFPQGLTPQTAPVMAKTPSSASRAASPYPAELRWHGPERVYAGSPFEVVLKLSAAQPLSSSPLELHYDAKLLEPLGVKAGGFFPAGKFRYRVVSAGAIHVGASEKGTVGDDQDFLVVTFRPIRPGATAELTVSSLAFQGPAGDDIAHEPPAAFRTTIIR
jgi:hypothetical protein